MPQTAFFSMHRWSSGQLKNDANTTVVAFVLLRNCRFSFHCYTQHEAAPTQKSAPKWQLWRFVTSYMEHFHLCKPALLNCPVRKMPWSLLWYYDSDPGSRTQELEEMMRTVCLLGCALLLFLCLVDYIWILDIIYWKCLSVSSLPWHWPIFKHTRVWRSNNIRMLAFCVLPLLFSSSGCVSFHRPQLQR